MGIVLVLTSNDESDLEEEQDSDDLPIIPTRKANLRTESRPKLIIPKKDVPVRPHAIKRAISENHGRLLDHLQSGCAILRQKQLTYHFEWSYMSPSL